MQKLPLKLTAAICILLGTASCKQPKFAFGVDTNAPEKPSPTAAPAVPTTPSISGDAFTFVGPKAPSSLQTPQ